MKIPKDIVHIMFSQYHCRIPSQLSLSNNSLTQLQSVTFSNSCCENVDKFVLDGLPNLEEVKIGENCFILSVICGICQISNCSKLRQLEIGKGSFALYQSFVLFNTNSLQSIKFDDYCFRYADKFSLKGTCNRFSIISRS